MISLGTALGIQANETEVVVSRGENRKYGYEICCIVRGESRSYLTSKIIYDSKAVAVNRGRKLLDLIKGLDLSDEIRNLSADLGSAAEII